MVSGEKGLVCIIEKSIILPVSHCIADLSMGVRRVRAFFLLSFYSFVFSVLVH